MDRNPREGIDLHIHSNASDGTLSPAEILARAQVLGLRAIAITDHDCVDGTREALSLGIPETVRFVTGVEISASPPPFSTSAGSFHILGYAFRSNDAVLNQTLAFLQAARKDRNPKIIRRLNRLGMDITLEEVRLSCGDAQLGRPHIARTLVEKGYVQSIGQAFDRYIATGQPAYVNKERVSCARAIEVIRNAGGLPVLAHPYLLNVESPAELERLVIELKQMGLIGIEVYYPEHTPDDTARYAAMARRHHLLMTGGTDFHGAIKPDIEMGCGSGDFHVPYEVYEKLMETTRDGCQQTDPESKKNTL